MSDKEKRIKSYVIRSGRLSKLQKNAIDELYDAYCIPFSENQLDLNEIFQGKEVVLEIGFGMGETTSKIAASKRDTGYLGIEVHKPGVGKLLSEIKIKNLDNIRIIKHDAVDVANYMIKDSSLDGIHIFFPDPWPKKRHKKRRLINPDFISLLSSKLKKGGYIYAATDWEDYADQILDVFSSCKYLKNKYDDFAPKPDWRPLTKFETRGLKKNHKIRNIIFIR